MFLSAKKGFTLIELLVVIAIISLLSSVVLTTLSNARVKARDSAIKKSVLGLRNFIELSRDTYGTYAYIQTTSANQWWSNLDNSTTPASGKYNCSWLGPGVVSAPPRLLTNLSAAEAADIQQICENIVILSSGKKVASSGSADYVLRLNASGGIYNTTDYYSIMVRLASGPVLCLGSSGRSSETGTTGFYGTNPADPTQPGCMSNP